MLMFKPEFIRPNPKQVKDTGILLALVLMITGIWLQDFTWIYWASATLLLVIIFPVIFFPLALVWFGLASLLSLITSQILLTILFFLLVTPVGIIRRWMGKDTLKLQGFKKDQSSVFIQRNHRFVANDLLKPY
jgi:hypothetical protein